MPPKLFQVIFKKVLTSVCHSDIVSISDKVVRRIAGKGIEMVEYKYSLLETGYTGIKEYVDDFYKYDSLMPRGTDKIRKQHCDKCGDVFKTCNGCFIHDALNEIYKISQYA